MLRRLLAPIAAPVTVVAMVGMVGAASVASLGCESSEPVLIGEHWSSAPHALPNLAMPPSGELPPGHPGAKGGGPPPSGCHRDPGDLGRPFDVPEGFEQPDESETSPAHPPHLRTPAERRKGIEENI
ncbi:MAG: hypothetical protein HYV09_17820 [Deltaproteobacteria bacterium]|nr:hypothetical protein [Deltaproteobacteria bacterium]